MSLKDLISSLIESAFTSKKSFISNQAMPNDSIYSTQEFVSESSSEYVNTISPVTGYATFWTNDGSAEGRLRAVMRTENGKTDGIASSIFRMTEATYSLFIPVVKGRTINHLYTRVGSSYEVRFIETIGGGISSILQALGGGLCLLSHLSRVCSISSQRKLISTVTCKQPPQIGQLNNSRPTAKEEKSKQLAQQAGQFCQQLMDGFACNRTAQDCTYKLNTAHLLSRWNRKTMCQQHFRFGKAGKLATISRALHCLIHLALSFQQSAKNSFAMGGAL